MATVTKIPVKNCTETLGHKKEEVGENSEVVLKYNYKEKLKVLMELCKQAYWSQINSNIQITSLVHFTFSFVKD